MAMISIYKRGIESVVTLSDDCFYEEFVIQEKRVNDWQRIMKKTDIFYFQTEVSNQGYRGKLHIIKRENHLYLLIYLLSNETGKWVKREVENVSSNFFFKKRTYPE